MWRAIARAGFLLLICLTLSGWTHGSASSSCPANDGSAGAPSGTAQYPTLLSGYTKTIQQAGCKVAGVDYHVGYGSGVSLTDWQSISVSGVTVNTGTSTVTCSNTSNVTLNGIDFSLHNGAIAVFTNCPNGTISNSNFGGSNYATNGDVIIKADSNSSGFTFTENTVDGDGAGTSNGLLGIEGSGTNTITYNYLKNFPSQALDAGVTGTNQSITYKYNLIENGGQQTGAHLNYQQLTNITYATINSEFNTTKQVLEAGGAGEGFQWYANASGNLTITTGCFCYNTMIATGTDSMSYMVHGSNSGDTITSGVMHDNYFDPTGTDAGNSSGVFYPSTFSQWTLSNNWDMVTGGAVTNNP